MSPSLWTRALLVGAGLASSVALPQPSEHQPRAQITSLPTLVEGVADEIANILGGLGGDASEASQAVTAVASVLTAAKPTASPTDVTQAQATLSSIFAPRASGTATPNLIADSVELITNGFTRSDLIQNVLEGSNQASPLDSVNNTNTRNPKSAIYPRYVKTDAPYSQTEQALRGAIHIPDTFTYGKKLPLLLVPGTGAFGGSNFESNMIKLFQGGDVADPVWLNIPGALLGDIQVSGEFVAYAIGYIQGITNRKTAVASWSQGSLDIGWAFEHWASTRAKVTDVINYSSDYKGTVLAYALNPAFPSLPITPSVIQQESNSTFIETFRNAGGGSAYVPTTTIYSAFFDEIVQPQTLEGASAYIQDTRNVGVSNNEVQSVCSGKPAGGFYTHEGILYHPLAYALTVDALTHKGPGSLSRLDLNTICNEVVAPGLSLDDVFATEALIPLALLNIVAYPGKTRTEPPIMSYAK